VAEERARVDKREGHKRKEGDLNGVNARRRGGAGDIKMRKGESLDYLEKRIL